MHLVPVIEDYFSNTCRDTFLRRPLLIPSWSPDAAGLQELDGHAKRECHSVTRDGRLFVRWPRCPSRRAYWWSIVLLSTFPPSPGISWIFNCAEAIYLAPAEFLGPKFMLLDVRLLSQDRALKKSSLRASLAAVSLQTTAGPWLVTRACEHVETNQVRRILCSFLSSDPAFYSGHSMFRVMPYS
ncbi:hypothetical protein B0H21DRAFT_85436 [Amylocystis lapponica]|nr:hypothetical protein B0H21DRAFT_85436 [Amylocystis lapponica]